ncbi:unnamed protein product [Notodromas monacha]|uniref:Uncharacterized protein n=1 Tax=Notodromas monacha TaxID=399045 RepID=A0A7R9GHJ6_9CRUS|nr:unnamed protein product [Notodromas monacha]CAG0921420.1 unnamed protein product [Notodromas monacha]
MLCFCEQVPAPKKRVCEDTDIAYVVETTYPHIETMRIGQNFRHFCTCPLNTKFELKEYYTKNGPLADIDISEYTCAPLAACKPEDSCKTVTETPDSFIVENNCACPSPSKCPTSGKPSQEMPVGKGVVKFIPCQ